MLRLRFRVWHKTVPEKYYDLLHEEDSDTYVVKERDRVIASGITFSQAEATLTHFLQGFASPEMYADDLEFGYPGPDDPYLISIRKHDNAGDFSRYWHEHSPWPEIREAMRHVDSLLEKLTYIDLERESDRNNGEEKPFREYLERWDLLDDLGYGEPY